MTTQELAARLEAMAKYEEAGEYHLAAKRLRAAASRLSALEAENKRLREALEPFTRNVFGGNQHAEALKKARAALESKP